MIAVLRSLCAGFDGDVEAGPGDNGVIMEVEEQGHILNYDSAEKPLFSETRVSHLLLNRVSSQKAVTAPNNSLAEEGENSGPRGA